MRTLGVAVAASAVMAAGLKWLVPAADWWLTAGMAARIVELSVAVGAGAFAYGAGVFALGVRPRHLRHHV